MAKYFKLARYKELLKVEESGNDWFLNETFLGLLNYRASIETQTSYNQKENYVALIEKHLVGVIGLYEFRRKFLEMEKDDAPTAN